MPHDSVTRDISAVLTITPASKRIYFAETGSASLVCTANKLVVGGIHWFEVVENNDDTEIVATVGSIEISEVAI